MTQTLYAHMNKRENNNNKKRILDGYMPNSFYETRLKRLCIHVLGAFRYVLFSFLK
jgi:hypothetical protein